MQERKEANITAIIEEEKLKPEETRRFIDNAFHGGALKTIGTAIDKIMQPVLRFSSGGRAIKKQGIIDKLSNSLRSIWIGISQNDLLVNELSRGVTPNRRIQ